jgi:hypothetical protein
MSRGTLLIAALTMFSAAFGQGQTTNPSTTTAPINGPFGGPMLVTPSAAFPTPVPTAGISDAGRAGISNATNGSETTTGSASPGTGLETPSASLSEPTASSSEVTGQAPTTDLGTSILVRGPADESGASLRGASDASGASTISLAEVSNRYKAEKGTRNAKVLSNEDVQAMLNNKGGVTMAKNMPPLGSGALEQGAQAQSTGSQSGTQSNQQNAQTNASANQPAQNAVTSQGGTPPPAANGQSANNGVSAENSTTPQINQKQQSNDAQGSRRLPATATFLPLLGLLGLVSGGIGLWFRKSRN